MDMCHKICSSYKIDYNLKKACTFKITVTLSSLPCVRVSVCLDLTQTSENYFNSIEDIVCTSFIRSPSPLNSSHPQIEASIKAINCLVNFCSNLVKINTRATCNRGNTVSVYIQSWTRVVLQVY